MLNRLFVIIGVFVILCISAAFLLPRLISWGDYRPRLEAMASQALGAPVTIDGNIQMTLLPQPQLQFTKIRVGPKDKPSIEVETVEAEFSLLDFFRDQYHVTRLTIEHPVIRLTVAGDGTVHTGVVLAQSAGTSNVSVANAELTDGTVQIVDERAGQTLSATSINGQLRLDAVRGPFSFQGKGVYGAEPYSVRLTTGVFDAGGATTISAYLKPDSNRFTLETSGALQTGDTPKFAGDLTLRVPPPPPRQGEPVDAGRGDFVLTGKLEAIPDRVLFSNYVALPDENRSATRLTGAGEIKLGKTATFNAVVSGGVMALPPRDATKELTDAPYELVRLLGETPLPPIPPIAGTIGLDVNEINLRAVSLRNLRLDAATDGKSWTIRNFGATLPGGARVGLTGTLDAASGKPVFAGNVSLATDRLDLFAALYRKPQVDNPLFNTSGSLSAGVALSGDTLTLSNGALVIGGINQAFDAEIGFGPQRHLKLNAHLTSLGPAESSELAALLPDASGSGSFGATFPTGEIDLSVSRAVLFGLDASDLAAIGSWEGGVLELSKVTAGDLGGVSFDARITAFGTLLKPEFSGSALLRVNDQAPAFAATMNALHAPAAFSQFIGLSLPARLDLQLDAPTGDGAQALRATGKLGTAETVFAAKLANGIVSALTSPITAQLEMNSTSPHMMVRQFGLGDLPLFDDRTPLHFKGTIDGVPANSYEAHLTLDNGTDQVTFGGNVVPGDFTAVSGQGDLDVALGDPSGLAATLGGAGLYVPPIAGTAKLQFNGLESAKLTSISAGPVGGNLDFRRNGQAMSVTGTLTAQSIDVDDLLPLLTGPAGTLKGPDGLWPDGPIDIGSAGRSGDGRVEVAAAALTLHGQPFATDAHFGFGWSAQSVELRELSAAVDGGVLRLDASVCCSAASQPAKQISGRLALEHVPVASVLPSAIAGVLGGKIDASAQFDATGATLTEAVANATGTGSYTVDGLSVGRLDPSAFATLGRLSGIADMPPDDLGRAVTDALAGGSFAAPTVTGSFTINNGVLRSPNVAATGDTARVFGGAALDLKTFAVDGRYAMSPTTPDDPASAVDATTAEVAAVITGPMWAPMASYDVAALIDGMKIRANEIELARLEKIKADADARAASFASAEASRASAEAAASASAEEAASSAASAAASASADAASSEAAAAASSSAVALSSSSVEPPPPVAPAQPAPAQPAPRPASSRPPSSDLGL